MRPAVRRPARGHPQPALRPLDKHLAHQAGVARPIDYARHDDHQRQTVADHRLGNPVMGQPFGPLVSVDEAVRVPVGFVHELAARVREHADRAGIDAFGNRQLAHQLEHVARALDVDPLHLRGVADADLVPSRHVEDAVRACHRTAHALFVGDVAPVHADAQLGERACPLGRPGDRH